MPSVATIRRNSVIGAWGDSLTGNGGSWSPFFAKVVKAFTSADRAAGIAVNTLAPTPSIQSNDLHSVWQPIPNGPQMQVDGFAGTGIQFLLDNYATRVAAMKPDPTDMFIWLSPNDCGSFTGAAYQAKYDQVIEQMHSTFPAANIVGVSILCIGEKWDSATGPGWGPNAQDANIALLNSAIAASCASHSRPYLDLRALALAANIAGNTSPVVGTVHGNTFGAITGDGTHPARGGGEDIAGGWIYNACTVVTT
jgi:hypothetical protein